ncbi:hypothetical protein MKW92_025640 [Papaver armeniacum]|nr:hypothetical protein MKW92_025640 [Papaver armeniacum]
MKALDSKTVLSYTQHHRKIKQFNAERLIFRTISPHSKHPKTNLRIHEMFGYTCFGDWIIFLRSIVVKAAEEKGGGVEENGIVEKEKAKEELEVIISRVYDATAIGEPLAIGKDKSRVWEKLMNARIVYLGEAEQVPVRDDKELELEIVKNLRNKCLENERPISLALEAFPLNLQQQLNQYMDKSYCRDNGVRLVACGTPLENCSKPDGISALSKEDRKLYAPPAGSGFIAGFSSMSQVTSRSSFTKYNGSFRPSSYLSVQARVVEDYTMSQVILQATADGGSTGMLVVITGASHVMYGSRGTGLPGNFKENAKEKSDTRPCSRNCFDRAEIARVMNAAGRRRDALPQDIQTGLDRGLIAPEVLQNFLIWSNTLSFLNSLTAFQGFRERLLADPKFLNRLAIEECISITTTLIAQYERRKENFFEEIDYVITDTIRGAVVDFFTNIAGRDWQLQNRVASVLVGGLKLAGVGFISSIGAVASSNILNAIRDSLILHFLLRKPAEGLHYLNQLLFMDPSFNMNCINIQIIAGLVEHRIGESLQSSQPGLVNQWIDLARSSGLQKRKGELTSSEISDTSEVSTLSSNAIQESGMIEETQNQSGDNPT